MASDQRVLSPICDACKTITFHDLCAGFDHPLTYREAIISARRCKFCRLMVCTFARRQVLASPYEVNDDYDGHIPQLVEAPMVVREAQGLGLGNEFPMTERFEVVPEVLTWKVLRNMSERGEVNGCFSDGATIQVSAPEDSAYLSPNIIANREICDANCERNNSLLYTWLRNCVGLHPECRSSFTGDDIDDDGGPVLPTRVIDVGPPNGSEASRLLVTSKGQTGTYVTLSHRWGRAQKIRTLKNNLTVFQKRLPVELPQTILDAIYVTRRLAERYLWIDSICIIQDDRDDWEKEAKQMGTIFERAILTIAAIDAIDDETGQDHGLFLPRLPDPLSVRLDCAFDGEQEIPPEPEDPCFVDEESGWSTFESMPFSQFEGTRDLVLQPRWKGLHHTLLDTLWYTRGWILQERLLSRRLIYYTKRKVFWECKRRSHDEENQAIYQVSPMRAALAEGLDNLARCLSPGNQCTPEDFRFWQTIVVDYSTCNLTKVQDKLAAITGLSQRVESKIIERPIVAGILGDPWGLNLLWHVRDDGTRISPPIYHAPSWTWASVSGPVAYETIPPISESLTTKCVAEDVDFHISSECYMTNTSEPLSCLQGSCCGFVRLTAPKAPAFACERLHDTGWQSNAELISILGSSIHREEIPLPREDASGNTDIPRRRLTLPLRTRVLRDPNDRNIGWFIPDEDLSVDIKKLPIICAVILVQHGRGGGQALMDPVKGFDYAEEDIVEFVALRTMDNDNTGRARQVTLNSETQDCVRVGRGRVVRKGWLDSCEKGTFRVQ